MAIRIVGVDLPQNKRGEVALTYIYGIGRSSSAKILDKAGVDKDLKVKDWTDDQAAKIREIIGAEFKVEGDLRSEVQLNIKRLMDIGCYRGVRHRIGLPVRPCVKIADAPRFAYRGMHLDVARHFFSVDEVKRYIDVMAIHKLNTLHWHLTDDQGWRIEIKRYPELTAVGSIRKATVVRKEWGTYQTVCSPFQD